MLGTDEGSPDGNGYPATCNDEWRAASADLLTYQNTNAIREWDGEGSYVQGGWISLTSKR